jgi:hypothetical protein
MQKLYKTVTFRRLAQDEKIQHGDFHSLDEGRVLFRLRAPETTVGDIPASFSSDRSFWRIETMERLRDRNN